MEKRIYKVKPILESRPWGGHQITKTYGYKTDLPNISQVYLAMAIPNHLDNEMDNGEKLSDFYHNHQELFDCKAENFPVRLAIANAAGKLSYHLHPTDAYASEHENGLRGKLEGSVDIDGTGKEYLARVGHTAKTKEEFLEMLEERDFDRLIGVKVLKSGDYHHMPYGTLHGGGHDHGPGDSISVSWCTNGDISYRLYDWDRKDPERPLHIVNVLDCLSYPDKEFSDKQPDPYKKDGCLIYDYYSAPGEFVARRIKTDEVANFSNEEFMFIFNGKGDGEINGLPFKHGETIFVPAHYGQLKTNGIMDLFIISYVDKE